MWWLLACTGSPSPAPAAPAAPDVVLVSWDTVSAAHLSLYGGEVETPNLAALAARGTRYDHAYTHFTETAISHWTMMTGAEPALHGPVPAHRRSAWNGPTLAQRLRARGYATSAYVSGVTMEAALTGLGWGFEGYDDGGDPRREPKRSARETTDRALAWVAAHEATAPTQPFFLFVHLFDAHYPYEPDGACDPGYAGSVDGSAASLAAHQGFAPPAPVLSEPDLAHVVRLYGCEIAGLDRELGRLVAGLPADARVMVVADHGESFGHGYYFNHRGVVTDEVSRVPMVLVPTDGPAVSGELVGLADVMALLMGEPRAPREELATLTDPWEGTGLLAIRRAGTRAVWALERGDPARARRGEDGAVAAPLGAEEGGQPAAALPEALAGAVARYEARIAAEQGSMRRLPPAPPLDEDLTARLQALGYLTDEAAPPD